MITVVKGAPVGDPLVLRVRAARAQRQPRLDQRPAGVLLQRGEAHPGCIDVGPGMSGSNTDFDGRRRDHHGQASASATSGGGAASSAPGFCQRTTSSSPLGVERDRRAVADLARQQRAPDARLDLALDEAPQRPRAVDGVVALAGDQLARGLGELERRGAGRRGAGAGRRSGGRRSARSPRASAA